MRFAHPEAFLLLLLLPPVLWRSLRSRRAALQFSRLGAEFARPGTLAVWGPTLLAGLRAVVLALLITALARPQSCRATETIRGDGITIELVIDNSYSMKTPDYDLGSQSISRLEAVKLAMRLFVQGGEHGLTGRPHDRIGVITFARDPEVVCPATLDHEAVIQSVMDIPLSPPVGTNIGDALVWAIDRLRQEPTREKVIILLSDGAHNTRDAMPPLAAAELARDLKVKIYTVGAVGNRFRPSLTRRQLNSDDEVDEAAMQRIAELTGGRYFRATDTQGLLEIYQAIDQLEKSQIEQTVHLSFQEKFFGPLALAIAFFGMEQLLAATRLLRVP